MTPGRPRFGRTRRGAAALALAWLAASCAPHRVALPPVPAAMREARYRELLARREALGRAVEAEVTIWARSRRSGAWPGATAYLALAAPDAVRIRVASLFGTAFDGAAHGDSVIAHLPARRLGVAADAARDSLGVRLPGRLGFRAFAAAWRPPESGWGSTDGPDSLLTLRWAEGDDSLAVSVGSSGMPVSVTIARGDTLRVNARYRTWVRHGAILWPSLIEFDDGPGGLTVRCKIERVRFRERPDPSRLVVRPPAGTDYLDWPGFRRALEHTREL